MGLGDRESPLRIPGTVLLGTHRGCALTGALRRASAEAGRADHLSLWAGQGVAAVRPLPAASLVATLEAEWRAALAAQAALLDAK